MSTPINTGSTPRLDLNVPLGNGLPFPLPVGTEITCTVTAQGFSEEGGENTETVSTNTVTLVGAPTDPPPAFIPNSMIINLSNGSGSASAEIGGDITQIAEIEWEVTTSGGSGTGTLTLDDPFNGTDKMIIDAGFAFGRNQARLNLSGTGTPGAVVKCQDNTTGEWNQIATVQGNGTWQSEDATALVTVNPSHDLSGDWYKVRVRLGDDDATIVESTNTFLPGLVTASVSQSELRQGFDDFKNIWEDDEIPLENDHNFQMLFYFDNLQAEGDGGAWTSGEFTAFPERMFFRSDVEGYNSQPMTGWLRHIANLYNQTLPGIPILFVSLNWSGTGRRDAMAERAVPFKRDWRFTSHAVQWCRDRGTEIGIFSETWWANDLARQFDIIWAPLYTKVSHQGADQWSLNQGPTADYNLGDDFGGELPTVHCLYDATTGVADNDFGEGLLRKDSSKYNILAPNWFNSSSASAGFLSSSSLPPFGEPDGTHPNAPDRVFKNSSAFYAEIAGGADAYGSIDFDNLVSNGARGTQARSQRIGLTRFFQHDYHNNFMTPLGIDPNVVCHGEWSRDGDGDGIKEAWSDLTHGAGNVIRGQGIPQDNQERAMDGVMKHLEYQFIETAKTAGFIDYPIPVFVLVDHEPDGSSITLEVQGYDGQAIPSDATLETLRSLRGQPPLVRDVGGDIRNGDNTTRNEVMGFEILREADGGGFVENDWRINGGGEGERAALHATYEGFDCSFDRTTNNLRLKITPDVPFQSGDRMRYNFGANIGWTFNMRDNTDQVYKSAPILHVPGVPIDGIPVAAWPRTPDIIFP